MKNECIFCKILEGNKLLYKDDLTAAFADISPKAPTHILVIPKKHVESLSEIDSDLSNAIFSAINNLTRNLKSFRIVVNFGKDAGQAVSHLHFHILAGRKFDWPPG